MTPKKITERISLTPKTVITTVAFLFVILLLNGTYIPSLKANPFLGTPKSSQEKKAPIVVEKQKTEITFISQTMMKISLTQLKLRQTMSKYIRDYKEKNEWTPLLPLFLLSFLYGVIHAAGPGHGKGIAVAYTLSKGSSFTSGLTLGSLIALFHAGSAIALVLLLQVIFHKSITSNLDAVTQKSQLISYALLTLIGLLFLISSLREWFEKEEPSKTQNHISKTFTNPVSAALAIGIVPCPGVIMILLFCLSLGQMTLGVLLGITVSFGMALTITTAVWISIAGKNFFFSATPHWKTTFGFLEKFLHTTSALLLTSMGAFLFYVSLQ